MQSLIDYLSAHPHLALAAVFAASLLEALAVIGTVIPGSTIVFAGGVLIGLQVIGPWSTAALAVTGAILGDGISYWLGHRYHERIRTMWPMSRYPALFDRGQAYFDRNGGRSVFLGRFLGPLRAIVPVIAGMSNMPPARFYAMNVLSALAWSAAHILPGVLFGASLQLAGAVSSRLAVLLVVTVVLLWAAGKLARWILARVMPRIAAERDRWVARARRGSGLPSRAVLSLFDRERPESRALLIAAVLLIGGTWLFLGILEDIVAGDPLVELDRSVYSMLQAIRTSWADSVFAAITALGGAASVVAVMLAVAALLLLERCWRTLGYWLAAAGFAEALVWVLKTAVGRARPSAIYSGVEQYSFPSGHAAMSITVYGFLAFLLVRGKSPPVKAAAAVLAGSLILLIAFSRLYLGVHWFSDVSASLALGLAWVALLAIAHIHHVRDERVSARALLLVASVALVGVGGTYLRSGRGADLARYAHTPTPQVVQLADWRSGRWRDLPPARSELAGEAEEPFSVQWAGTAAEVAASLAAAGWRQPPRWASKASVLWLLPSTSAEMLPVLAKLDHGEPQKLTFVKVRGPLERIVLRLWPSRYAIGGLPGGEPRPLWNAMVSSERLRRPMGLMTISTTSGDFAAAARTLAEDMGRQRLSAATRERGGFSVLLLW